MALAVFQRAQLAPITTKIPPSRTTKTPSYKLFFLPAVSGRFRNARVVSQGLLPTGVSVPYAPRLARDCSPSSSPSPLSPLVVHSGPVMKGEFGSSTAITLEKPKLASPDKESVKTSPEIDTGGGGGDIGKIINTGGGGGGDDGGDDDDNYFDNFDDGDEGDEDGLFRLRTVFPELFDRKFVDAVLTEWHRTVMNLPAGFRLACEMGLVSSAQLVKFLANFGRPTTVRTISWALPQAISRALIGRMITDPAFLYRLLLEQAATIGCSVWAEVQNRKERIKEEWDLALVNVLTASICNAIVVWSLAPCRSYGNTFRFDLQNTIQKLPNNIFEMSYPHRKFDLQKRIHSFFFKAAELCLVGMTAGATQVALSNVSISQKKNRSSMAMPSVNSNALGYGAFLGLYANFRYQFLCGLDQALTNHFDVLRVALFFSTALRILNVQLGEMFRLAWLGIEADPLVNSNNLPRAYNRPSVSTSEESSKWFISKESVVSGLGQLGIRLPGDDSVGERNAPAPKARRKRMVKKKVAIPA